MNNKRPVFLNLFLLKFPMTAIVSILHRLSGFVLFLGIPLFLNILGKSLASFGDFVEVQSYLQTPFIKFIFFLLLSGLSYHLIAGIRHLFMDFGIGDSLAAGRLSAWWVIGLNVTVMLLIGIWLW